MTWLIDPEQSFPSLTPGRVHCKAARQRPEGYPERRCGQGPLDWSQDYPGYAPESYTAARVAAGPEWADPADREEARRSRPGGLFHSDEPGGGGERPRNPRGRSGLRGRGLLGRWGANAAADPIVTRVAAESGCLQMVAILRNDSHQWAIPGGMADPGESPEATLARELTEEALGKGSRATAALEERLRRSFECAGQLVYAGYVDDPRNTDEAWIETRAVHLHLSGAEAELALQAGDDAGRALWVVIDRALLSNLYANHGELVGRAVSLWQERAGVRVREDGRVERM